MTPLAATWGRFDLPPREARVLVGRMFRWTCAAGVTGIAAGLVGWPGDPAVFLGLCTAAGVVAARPVETWLLAAAGLFVFAGTVLLGRLGVPVAMAAGAAAGLVVGCGSALSRVEAVLAGVAAGGLGHFVLAQLPLAGTAWAVVAGLALGLATSQALLPGALRFAARFHLPPGRFVATTLAEPYRPPCYRAIALDTEVSRRAPDPDTRNGLREVGGWVYRLALTLQTLDGDVAAIDPVAVTARLEALGADDPDSFVQERRRATRAHLERLLTHRDTLVRERARVASLQDYALAWLEEARAGLALAQRLPAEAAPERLDVVLEKLRKHATEVGVRRDTARELGLA